MGHPSGPMWGVQQSGLWIERLTEPEPSGSRPCNANEAPERAGIAMPGVTANISPQARRAFEARGAARQPTLRRQANLERAR